MYALPGQGVDALERDLATALSFAPPHLSYYQLALEPNTLFAAHPPQFPDDDTAAGMQERIEQLTAEAGLAHYEISAYARPGHRCRHNLNYWQFGDYLGIGAGAHGKTLVPRSDPAPVAFSPPAALMSSRRCAAPRSRRSASLSPADLPFEFMLNALRLVDGVPSAMFGERTGLSLAAIAHRLDDAAARGLLDPDPAGSARRRWACDSSTIFSSSFSRSHHEIDDDVGAAVAEHGAGTRWAALPEVRRSCRGCPTSRSAATASPSTTSAPGRWPPR